MINMILYQNGKSLQEIMFLMSEAESRGAFRRKENNIKLFYYFLVATSCLVYIYIDIVEAI